MGRARRRGHYPEHGKHFTRHRSAAKFITSPSEETMARGSGALSKQTSPRERRGGQAGERVCIRPPSLQWLCDNLAAFTKHGHIW